MSLIKSNSIIRFLVIPLALCAVMFNARCKDDDNDEFIEQALLNLASCPGGTMALSIDGAPATTWTCCIANDKTTYWEVVASHGSQVIRLYFGKLATPNTYTNDSLKSNHEYIEYITGGTSFCGVEEYSASASSSITIDDDTTSITGSFTGTLYNSSDTIFHTVDCSDFEALK